MIKVKTEEKITEYNNKQLKRSILNYVFNGEPETVLEKEIVSHEKMESIILELERKAENKINKQLGLESDYREAILLAKEINGMLMKYGKITFIL